MFARGMSILSRAAWGLVLALLVFYVFSFLNFSAVLLRYPFDYDQPEGNVILVGKLLETGRPLYDDPNNYPKLPYVYPPFFPLLISVFTALFGGGVMTARLISLLSTAGICLLIYRIVRSSGAPRWISALSSLLMFSYPLAAICLTFARSDAF